MERFHLGGRLSGRTAARLILLAAAGIGLLLFTLWLNRVEIVPLISREGQTFEKAVVTQILQDNRTETGTRVGEQVVEVRILTGEKKGELLEVTSSAGFLFGAPCTPGMRVVVMQSVAGDTTIASVYSQDREWVIYLFGILYLAVLVLVGGKQGVKGGIGLVFTFFSILLWYLPMVYRGFSPFWSAVFICIITTLVTMLLIGGFTKKTLVATIGTVGGVLTAGISATLFSGYTPQYLPDATKYANGTITEDYVPMNFKLPTADGDVKRLGIDSRFPWARLPCETGAGSTTYYSDYYYFPRYATCAARVGGYWNGGSGAGPCYWYCNYAPSDTSVNYRARHSYSNTTKTGKPLHIIFLAAWQKLLLRRGLVSVRRPTTPKL